MSTTGIFVELRNPSDLLDKAVAGAGPIARMQFGLDLVLAFAASKISDGLKAEGADAVVTVVDACDPQGAWSKWELAIVALAGGLVLGMIIMSI